MKQVTIARCRYKPVRTHPTPSVLLTPPSIHTHPHQHLHIHTHSHLHTPTTLTDKKKLDAAKEVHSMLSYDTMRMLQAEYRLDDEDMDEDMEAMGNNALPASIANSLREFVCFSALFEAYDSYKEFYISVRNKPATADVSCCLNALALILNNSVSLVYILH